MVDDASLLHSVTTSGQTLLSSDRKQLRRDLMGHANGAALESDQHKILVDAATLRHDGAVANAKKIADRRNWLKILRVDGALVAKDNKLLKSHQ